MAKSNRQETPQEFRARMLSLSYMPKGIPRDKRSTITRPENDPGVDAGKRAKVTTEAITGTTITESDNRQDVNIVPETVYQKLSVMQG